MRKRNGRVALEIKKKIKMAEEQKPCSFVLVSKPRSSRDFSPLFWGFYGWVVKFTAPLLDSANLQNKYMSSAKVNSPTLSPSFFWMLPWDLKVDYSSAANCKV